MIKKYKVIYADPAWGYSHPVYQETFPKRKQTRKARSINDEYETMSEKQLLNLPINNLADKDSALFLWVTDSHLKQGIALMEAWGFKYRTIVFIWKKITNKGNTCANVGAWTMKNCEICLFGARGNMRQYKEANNVFQLIEAERTKHSKKPNEARKRIETLFGGVDKIELFARSNFEEWDAWGNEVEDSIDLSEYYT